MEKELFLSLFGKNFNKNRDFDVREMINLTCREIQEKYGCTRKTAQKIETTIMLSKCIKSIPFKDGDGFDRHRKIYDHFLHLSEEKQECFMVVLLDNKLRKIGEKMVSKGTVDISIAHPRDIFRFAVEKSAKHVILVHNHPSGSSFPSKEDKEVTDRMTECGKLLKVEVLDHIIIGKGRYYAFSEKEEIIVEGEK